VQGKKIQPHRGRKLRRYATGFGPPFGTGDFSTKLDVLRSRAYFLKLLSPEEIDEYASAAIDGIDWGSSKTAARRSRLSVRREIDSGSTPKLGAVLETEARNRVAQGSFGRALCPEA